LVESVPLAASAESRMISASSSKRWAAGKQERMRIAREPFGRDCDDWREVPLVTMRPVQSVRDQP